MIAGVCPELTEQSKAGIRHTGWQLQDITGVELSSYASYSISIQATPPIPVGLPSLLPLGDLFGVKGY